MYAIHGRNVEDDEDEATVEGGRGIERAWSLHSEIGHHCIIT